MKKKQATHNSLSIRLTESAVFLRTDGTARRRNNHTTPQETRSSVLRGLLILDLVKPTKITSIDIELNATTSTAWPEGVGARRVEVNEEHRVYHASVTHFSAKHVHRRTASVGPGTILSNTQSRFDSHGFDDDPIEDELNDFEESEWDRGSGRFTQANEEVLDARRSLGVSRTNSDAIHHGSSRPSSPAHRTSRTQTRLQQFLQSYHHQHSQGPARATHSATSPIPQSFTSPSPEFQSRGRSRPRIPRRMSIDGAARAMYESYHEEHLPDEHFDYDSPQTSPPYSPLSSPSAIQRPGIYQSVSSPGTGQSSEEFRNSLQTSLATHRSRGSLSRVNGSGQSVYSEEYSRPPSSVGFRIPDDDFQQGSSQFPYRERSSPRTPRTHSLARSSTPSRSLSNTRLPEHAAYHPSLDTVPPGIEAPSSSSQSRPTGEERRRQSSQSRSRKSHFSLSAVSNALKEAVRSNPPALHHRPDGDHDDAHHERGRRGRSANRVGSQEGGLSLQMTESTEEESEGKERRGMLGLMLGDGHGKDKGKKHKEKKVEGWKEFPKGTYTYPISFNIPGNAPPTMACDYGSVTWRLKAHVHRPGAFKAKMTAVREVITIACPTEEDTEESENIIVERHWDQQLQYLISVSGKAFYIGGTMPISFALMPLVKMKIHRLSVFIEERVDYHTNMRRLARSDPVVRYNLLSVRKEGKNAEHILPLDSDDPEALRQSPVFQLMNPEDDPSEFASTLMGPGPWTFHRDLQLPKSCDVLKFTNKNKRANMVVTHLLKIVIRAERGDDLHMDVKTGRRKLFDIVVQTPVVILSCRCNPEWTSLPRYAEVFDDKQTITPSCPCQVAKNIAAAHGQSHSLLERITSRHSNSSTESSDVGAAETSPVNPSSMLSLRNAEYNQMMITSNQLFERLISGRETEAGEEPPAYSAVPPILPSGSRVNTH
ncbi:hypothetical protein CVT24_005985 [Panaeolus cyanescens]|uniref:Arrestin C-terminal-like domain-containing protein n=1 Tax=Panaeolus cyanescens TaxID=181874 RepID=A0A409VAY8_9AGAR|nr:hypothetical protein CVT24_005985 [Panaeolus cyanescens]